MTNYPSHHEITNCLSHHHSAAPAGPLTPEEGGVAIAGGCSPSASVQLDPVLVVEEGEVSTAGGCSPSASGQLDQVLVLEEGWVSIAGGCSPSASGQLDQVLEQSCHCCHFLCVRLQQLQLQAQQQHGTQTDQDDGSTGKIQ